MPADLSNSIIHFFSTREGTPPLCQIVNDDDIYAEWTRFDHTAVGKICVECQVLIGRAMTDCMPERTEFIDAFRKTAGKHYPHPSFGCECVVEGPVGEDGTVQVLQIPWEIHIAALAYESLFEETND